MASGDKKKAGDRMPTARAVGGQGTRSRWATLVQREKREGAQTMYTLLSPFQSRGHRPPGPRRAGRGQRLLRWPRKPEAPLSLSH